MAEQGFKRKLTAILSADVEGYSRLMGEDEEATVRTLKSYREVLTTLIHQHSGKVLDSPGDNMLAEFVSVVDAVQCGVAVQKEIKARNDEMPENRRMLFRIGINLGDVIQEEGRIYGDGVNIAARLEALSDPGGICISKTAFDHIESKLPYGYEFLGDQTVKNIVKPVGVYRVLMEPRVTVAGVPEKEKRAPKRRMPIFVGIAAVFALAVAVGIWQFYVRRPKVEPASVEKMALLLPDSPSVVVLPFDNLSDDPEQEYLADGITDQIITGLSRMPYIFIIARNTSLTYKGKPVKIQQISEELGVQYVLEGSVQRSGNRIRVTAQLIDALSGRHVWSERYDRVLEDLFAVQDDIMMNIMRAMEVKVAGLGFLEDQVSPRSVEAYLKILKAIELVYHFNKDDNALARKLYEEAIALDPEYGPAYVLLGWTYFHDATNAWTDDPVKSYAKAEELGKKAISYGGQFGHMLLMNVYDHQGQPEKALAEGEKALAVLPNSADLNMLFTYVLHSFGRHEEALARAKRAIRLNPHHPPWYFSLLAWCYFRNDQLEEAIETYQMVPNKDQAGLRMNLAVLYSQLGREAEARQEAEEVYRIDPGYSWEKYGYILNGIPDSDFKKRFFDGLQKVGLK